MSSGGSDYKPKFWEEFPTGKVPIKSVPNHRRLIALLDEPNGFYRWGRELLANVDLPGAIMESDIPACDPDEASELLVGVFGVPAADVSRRFGKPAPTLRRWRYHPREES